MCKVLSRREFIHIAASTVAGATVTSCAPAPAQQPLPEEPVTEPAATAEPVTLAVWLWPGLLEPIQGLEARFQEGYPNISLTFEPVSWADTHTKLITAIAAGAGAPDIAGCSDYKIGDFAGEGGGLADLTDWMASYQDDFVPVHWAEVVFGGKIWGVPCDAAPDVIYYRKDLFGEWGLDIEVIEVWDEYVALGPEVRERSGGESYLTCVVSRVLLHQDLAGQLGSAIYNTEGELIVDDEGNLQALVLLKKMVDAEAAALDVSREAMMAALSDGSYATYIFPSWFYLQQLQSSPDTSGKWHVVKMPAYEKGGGRASDEGGANLVIPRQSEHKDAARAFLEFANCTKEGQLEQFVGKGSLFPTFKPAYDDPVFDEPMEYYGRQIVRRVWAEVAAEAPAIFRGPHYMEARAILELELQAALAGDKTPEEALRDARRGIETQIIGS